MSIYIIETDCIYFADSKECTTKQEWTPSLMYQNPNPVRKPCKGCLMTDLLDFKEATEDGKDAR